MYSILNKVQNNTGGIKKFFFIPSADLKKDPRPNQNLIVNEIPIKEGSKWYKGEVTRFSLEYNERKRASEYPDYFEQSLQGVIGKSTPEKEEILSQFDNRRFTIVYLDQNGYLRFAGGKEDGLLFTWDFETGAEPGDRNQIAFTFEGESKRKGLYYDGALYDYLAGDTQPDFGDISIRALEDGKTYRILEQ